MIYNPPCISLTCAKEVHQFGQAFHPLFAYAGCSGLPLGFNLHLVSLLACNIVASIIERPPSRTSHYVWWMFVCGF